MALERGYLGYFGWRWGVWDRVWEVCWALEARSGVIVGGLVDFRVEFRS